MARWRCCARCRSISTTCGRTAGGRSLGELAWHLAEVDAFISLGIERRDFTFPDKPPHLDRPRQVEELAPAFRIVHDDAVTTAGRPPGRRIWISEIRYADGRILDDPRPALAASCCCTTSTIAGS